MGAVALPASAADRTPDRPKVEISAVQYDAPGRDTRTNRSLNKEWVELTNTTRRAVNLDGWTLSDADGHTYTFDHYRLAGRATVRIHTGEGRDARTDLYQDRRRRHLGQPLRRRHSSQRPRPHRRQDLLGHPPPRRPPLTPGTTRCCAAD